MRPPRFIGASLEAGTGAIENFALAAAIAALDVPLQKDRPFTSIAGDGIKGKSITWHFQQQAPNGDQVGKIVECWNDAAWIERNPDNPLSRIKEAFRFQAEMNAVGRREKDLQLPFFGGGYTVETRDTKAGAGMRALLHPLVSYSHTAGGTVWRFPQAAAQDLSLWSEESLTERFPDALISYVRAGLFNREYLIERSKELQFASVQHRGRTACIGRNMSKRERDFIEQRLYRK